MRFPKNCFRFQSLRTNYRFIQLLSPAEHVLCSYLNYFGYHEYTESILTNRLSDGGGYLQNEPTPIKIPMYESPNGSSYFGGDSLPVLR